jgi:antitoxin (DNA-binding transcriptional repressor) of toxin-antitoxin stability system
MSLGFVAEWWSYPSRSSSAFPASAGRSFASVRPMAAIPQREPRNHVSEVLGRVEAGKETAITVAGSQLVQLGPTERRRWAGGPLLHAIWQTPTSSALTADLERFPGVLDHRTLSKRLRAASLLAKRRG